MGDSGLGRWHEINLPTMSFAEYCHLRNVTDIAKELGDISKDNVSEYLDYFCSFGLLYKAEMIDKGGKKILKAQPNYHIADPALYAIFHQNPLSDKTAAGSLVESVVYKHIADAVITAGTEIGYLRDKKNRDKEIDVVFKYNNTFNYVEVKYQDNAAPKETDALMNLSRTKPEGCYIFLTKNNADGGIHNKEDLSPIIALPVHTFVYWVGNSIISPYSGGYY